MASCTKVGSLLALENETKILPPKETLLRHFSTANNAPENDNRNYRNVS